MLEIISIFSFSAIIFGILVIVKPAIVAYLLGGFFIYLGILGLGLAWRFKSLKRKN
ncbi:MAG: hypothetical protein PHW50_02400 [Patescibacteria group bacterium]|nr:hypothetical protein [Patescibacteria group bacterium]